MTNPAALASAADADALRAGMVEWLLGWGGIRSVPVESAMRAVPRHVFVPGTPLRQAYGSDSVVTHRDAAGAAVSSATGPGVVARMLEQLEVKPGHRVLEVGAGTGYNAACLAELTGPSGSVTTVDIGAEMAAGARRGLAAAGYDRVRVVHGDGADGYAPDAPYDRIIVTAGAWEVTPAWREQMAPGGRLVVPLRVCGITRVAALEQDDGIWRSVSVNECGFMPMRGPGTVAETNEELPGSGGVRIRADDGHPADVGALAAALAGPPALAWPGVTAPWQPMDLHLDFWLAGAGATVCRLIVPPQAVAAGLVPPLYPWGSMGCYSSETLGYITRRPGSGKDTMELGACAYGPAAQQLAAAVADRISAWSHARGLPDPRIEVHPAGRPAPARALITAEKQHSTVLVITPCPDGQATAAPAT